MREFLRKIKSISLIEALASIVIGILFIACQNFTKSTIVYLFASIVLVMGIIKCISYFMYGIEPFGFILGMADFALGIVLFASAEYLINSGVLGFTFGLVFIIKSLFSMQWSFDCRRYGAKYWWFDFIIALVIMVCGIILVCCPSVENVLLYSMGTILILEGLFDLVDTFVVSAKIKKARKTFKDLLAKENNVIEIENPDDENKNNQ